MNETVQHHRQPPGRAGMALTLLTYVLLFSVIIVVVTISDALPVWGDVIMLLSFYLHPRVHVRRSGKTPNSPPNPHDWE
jgi:hypothetical protein